MYLRIDLIPQGTARSQSEPEVGQFSQTLSLKPNWQSPNLQNSTKFVLKIKFWSQNSDSLVIKSTLLSEVKSSVVLTCSDWDQKSQLIAY